VLVFLHSHRLRDEISESIASRIEERYYQGLSKKLSITLVFLDAEFGRRMGLHLNACGTMDAKGLKVGGLITQV
jgi:hypothetical protein